MEQLQHFKVVTFYVEILCLVPVNTFFGARTQSFIDRCYRLLQCCSLTYPSEIIHFGSILYGIITEKQTEFIEINYTTYFPIITLCFREARRGNLIEGIKIQFCAIRRLYIYIFRLFQVVKV